MHFKIFSNKIPAIDLYLISVSIIHLGFLVAGLLLCLADAIEITESALTSERYHRSANYLYRLISEENPPETKKCVNNTAK